MTLQQEHDAALSRKMTLRAEAEEKRRRQPDKDALSLHICRTLTELPQYTAAQTVMLYLGVRNEVQTQDFVADTLQGTKRVVVPYCSGGQLGLFHLTDMDQLEQGTYGIPEPKVALRDRPEYAVQADRIDLVMVPGVAFDRTGGRLGYGKGYYDGLLRQVRPDAVLVGAAFACQLFDEVPMMPYDVAVDKIVTETTVLEAAGRSGGAARRKQDGSS